MSAKHAETIKKSTSLRTSARSFTPPCPHVSAFDQTPLPRLCGRPLWTAHNHNGPLFCLTPVHGKLEILKTQNLLIRSFADGTKNCLNLLVTGFSATSSGILMDCNPISWFLKLYCSELFSYTEHRPKGNPNFFPQN